VEFRGEAGFGWQDVIGVTSELRSATNTGIFTMPSDMAATPPTFGADGWPNYPPSPGLDSNGNVDPILKETNYSAIYPGDGGATANRGEHLRSGRTLPLTTLCAYDLETPSSLAMAARVMPCAWAARIAWSVSHGIRGWNPVGLTASRAL
jgi:hypothetical protein